MRGQVEGERRGQTQTRRTSRALRMQGATCSGGPVTISRIMDSIPSRRRSSSSTIVGSVRVCVVCVLGVVVVGSKRQNASTISDLARSVMGRWV